jgi:tRNA nucleotidyltransferase (CCA-adding enzyme)
MEGNELMRLNEVLKDTDIGDINYDLAVQLAKKVNEIGGAAYFVGGYVRDKLLGIPNRDIDIEIHNVTPYILENILKELGEVQSRTVGNNFGIYNIDGYDLDISLPRKEKATGKGHKDFEIVVDPFLSLEESAKRRDFTINALMEDILTGEIKDYFGGLDDLHNGVIRHIDDKTFIEDSLRVLRACQFAARFNFTIAPETICLCKTMDLSTLPKERIAGELSKALLKTDKPSVFFDNLYECKQTEWFKEVYVLKGIKQNSEYHPEGDAYNHTMYVLDEAADFKYMLENISYAVPFMLSALCHDFGKAESTIVRDDGKVQSIGHEKTGVVLATQFLDRIYNNKEYTKYVCNMVELHMKPHMCFYNKSKVKTTNLMFDKSVAPDDLIHLTWCDSIGHNMLKLDNNTFNKFLNKTWEENDYLINRLIEYKDRIKQPHITADDLIDIGLKPSPLFKIILDKAWDMHLKGVKKENVLKQIAGELDGEDKMQLCKAVKQSDLQTKHLAVTKNKNIYNKEL